MLHRITVIPQQQNIDAASGENLLTVLQTAGFFVNASCGGNGSCGKCEVLVDGEEVLACQTIVAQDMTVTLPVAKAAHILTEGTGFRPAASCKNGFSLAFDIGTTTVAGYLLRRENGQELTCESSLNPQASYGADVISRIQYALKGHMEELTAVIRNCITNLTYSLCEKAALTPDQITVVSIVGNPAMQQLFLGVYPENLAQIPFAPVLTQAKTVPAKSYIPLLENAELLIVPNISGFVGAKLLACNDQALYMAQELIKQVEFIELSSVSDFQGHFARNMRFDAPESYWCQRAVSMGFSKAVPMDVNTLQPRQDVRDMCTADKCGAYGKNWTCPPYCGTLDECTKKIQQYSRGILLQTVGITEKTIDTKAYRRTESQHLEQFHLLCEELRKVYPHALCLGSGGCRICGKCAFPESCRFPEKACSSMEGYGLFVTQVCRDNGCEYYYGEKTITYTACILF